MPLLYARPGWAVLTVLVLALALVPLSPLAARPASAVPGDPLTGSGAVTRSVLTAADLTRGTATGTVTNDAFALPAAAAAPTHTFEGTLTLNGVATARGFSTVKDTYDYADTAALKHLPPVSIDLVQNGSHVIPAVRGLQITGSAYWNLIVEGGRAWNENGDGGRTRASLPFALVERNANCVHNGLLTFLFDDSKISQVRYQITHETCAYFQFDMWGQVGATYSRHTVTGDTNLKNAYAAEVADRIPTKPISALSTDYPNAGIDTSAFGSGITASALSTYGVSYGGVNYVGACKTRQGAYPYCNQMVLPSFSLAKTMFAGIVLMRLTQVYGSSVPSQLIRDWVSEADTSAWTGVTFQDTANMATGNYSSSGFESDESGSGMTAFFDAEAYGPKMTAALAFPHSAAPGTKWVYHSSDTFVLARAMQNYLVSKAGAGSDIYRWIRDQVLVPLHLSPNVLTTERTGNSATGQPFGGYGLFYTQDDIAKVSRFLNADGGKIGGVQMLDPTMLADAMQQNPANRGITTPADTTGKTYHYQYGLWARQFTSADNPVFTSPVYVPFMSGFGGITAAMLPNGATYYYFSDNNEFGWSAAAAQAYKLPATGGGNGGGGTCTAGQLLGNGGFETGTASPWTADDKVVSNKRGKCRTAANGWPGSTASAPRTPTGSHGR
ncbi:beta-lactamase family protein [Streptomyces antimycoticus]|uniref:beta-lactamase family protein n=1 Tax=Streptomyces antimycoticus TaxID=68175 RepID=UPI001F1FF086|nr:beta-lactamase family protein [Streptomyces antimycoticus]